MKNKKFLLSLGLILVSSMFLTACGGSNNDDNKDANGNNGESSDDFTVAMVTDTGGIDDKSFNQSAWEGLNAWGEEHGKVKGADGFDYTQSEDDSDYMPNFSRLV